MPRFYKKRRYNYIPRRTTRGEKKYRRTIRNRYTSAVNKGLKKPFPRGVRSLIKGYSGIRKYRQKYRYNIKPRYVSIRKLRAAKPRTRTLLKKPRKKVLRRRQLVYKPKANKYMQAFKKLGRRVRNFRRNLWEMRRHNKIQDLGMQDMDDDDIDFLLSEGL